MIGNLRAYPATERPDLLAPYVAAAFREWRGSTSSEAFFVTEIDPDLADTAAFCERYDVPLDRSANCVILAARREGRSWFAA
ncbi:MAG: YbaK/EbsC family protein, partial [Vulcanimicrobiaceae bacterium]